METQMNKIVDNVDSLKEKIAEVIVLQILG